MPSLAHARRGVALASIAGIGVNRPASNEPLARRAAGPEITGVADRVHEAQGITTASLAAGAARAALAASGADPSGIEMIIVATTTPDVLWPATACLVQTDLQLPMVAAFDLYGAQAGMLTAVNVATHYVAAGPGAVLVIGAECDRQLVDLPGQGHLVHARAAAAAVLQAGEAGGGILSTVVGGAARSTADADGHAGLVEGITDAARDCVQQAGMYLNDIDLVLADSGAPDTMRAWASRAGVKGERLLLDPDRYGTLLAAAPFIVLRDLASAGRLTNGMTVLMLECGAGPVWAAACLQWQGTVVREW